MRCVHEEQRGDELRKNLKQVVMGSNEAATNSCYFKLFVPRPGDPSFPKLTQR